MPKKITDLTPEQEAAMPSYAKKWIDIGLRTGDTDWNTFDKYMPICYAKAKLAYPKQVIRVQSPLVGALASAIAEAIYAKYIRRGAVDGAVGDAVRDAVGGAVRDVVDDAVGDVVGGAVGGAVGDAVRDAVDGAVDDVVGDAVGGAVRDVVRGAVGDAVRDAVDGAVGGVVRGAVGDAVRDAVGGAVRDAVGGAVRDVVRGAVDDAVGGAVGGAVGDAVRGAVGGAVRIVKKLGLSISWHYWLGGQFWVGGWYYRGVAFVSFFFDVCGLKLKRDIMERAEAMRKVCESVNYIWPNSNFIMVCARPQLIHRDNQGRLHNEHGKAIEYPDGWGLYLLHGVRFPEELYLKVFQGMPMQDILAIEDIDQRTQAIKFAKEGIRDFYKSQKGKMIDHFVKLDKIGRPINYELWKIPEGEIFTKSVHFAVYDCPSARERGESREYTKGVPAVSTVAEAMAWGMSDATHTVTPEDWEAMIPLIDES
jgi:hypothetical protein